MATTEELLDGIILSKKAIIDALNSKFSLTISDETRLSSLADIISSIEITTETTEVTE